MSSFSIEIKGIDKLLAKIGQGRGERAIEATTRGIAELLKGMIAKYPGPVKRPIQWTSPAQRAWYMHARQGMGPYRRNSDPWSQRLGPSWTTQQRGLDAVVGTRVTYAKWVQSEENQQPMHRNTGWVTDQQVIERGQREKIADNVWNKVVKAWRDE